jgi:adenylate cyclase
LIDPAIETHKGRIANTAGDSLLLEFASAVDAVRCAMAVQTGLAERNADVPEAQRITMRIGINVGDVVAEDGDLLGDGVNLAARLEGLADAGGITLSDDAYRQVRDRLDVAWRDGGEHAVKNIARPVQTWCWSPLEQHEILVASHNAEPLALPDKPSIAVLPFDNLSGDKEQEFLADGLSETITSALAVIPELFVVARNSSFTYKGKATKVQQIARELGVRYVLEGSLQKAGDRLRVTAQLIDAANGHHLWSDRYDRKSADLFALQDDIALRIMSALQVKLTEGEKARLSIGRTRSLRAWSLAVKGRAAFLKFKKTENARARDLFQQAIEVDPNFIWGWRGIGWTNALDARRLWGNSYEKSLRLAKEAAARALEINPNDSEVHALLGNIHMLQGEFDAAIANGKKAIALAPNIADNYGVLAMTTHYVGDFKETIALSKKAMRLHPIHPAWYLYRLGNTQMLAGDYKNAIPTIKEYLKRNRTIRGQLGLATAYSLAGQTDKAKEIVKKLLVEKPSLSLKYAAKIHRFKDSSHLDRVLDALRNAGVPDNAPTN